MDDLFLEDLADLAGSLEKKREDSKLEFYEPYKFQKAWHNARDINQKRATQKALMAANQVGKTYAGGMETAMHLTGLYPDWYDGVRFNHPTECFAVSNSHDTCRDICQKELLGPPEELPGGGAIPKDLILDTHKKTGIPNAYDTAVVRHVPTGGTSKASFKAYEQGAKKHMGKKGHWIWEDEEPPQDIHSQFVRSILATNGIIGLTFTPEMGVTGVVDKFMNDLSPGMALVNATWDDAGHFKKDPERLKEILASMPEHEREMRSKGVPQMGSGLVFPVTDESIGIDSFPIKPWHRQIVGVDFGFDHPFAAARIVYDPDRDLAILYDGYKESGVTPPVHASRIRQWGSWIPCVWPHDGQQHSKGSGQILADQYRQEGLNFMFSQFSNPPPPDKKEGQGGIAIEPGLYEMLNRMQTGRFKVVKTLQEFFQEKRLYHRKDGKVVDRNDDLISATRYAVMSLRFAQLQMMPQQRNNTRRGARNW